MSTSTSLHPSMVPAVFNSSQRAFPRALSVPERPRKIYLASSWRNLYQPGLVKELRDSGHQVYDFKNPHSGNAGFSWTSIDENRHQWTARQYIAALDHPLAKAGFASDFNAMKWADTFILVLPCGRSAHLELGWACGMGKQTIILTRDGEEPELMAKMADLITDNWLEVMHTINS